MTPETLRRVVRMTIEEQENNARIDGSSPDHQCPYILAHFARLALELARVAAEWQRVRKDLLQTDAYDGGLRNDEAEVFGALSLLRDAGYIE